ncbi:signal peptidase II [Bifidobacterium commune]|uniref:Lipoprotein signal peptidase n=1 Tax=Bifidobacterium commune TaxID=1505727 RepID=A0A1C4GZT2_9BIFI|nr:signal peptidase II [Bifidobacterium commune]MBB2955217.1 signal peptidase II [Bifidobacterium commune]SCC78156.1 signal peptidase II . Aspartic peptidase. MEROPS family A08 [Bifidobacterium commune]
MKSISTKRLRFRVAVFLAVAVIAVLLDRLTKLWALASLDGDENVVVVPKLLSLTLVHNPGASLGLGSSVTWLISCLASVACVVLAYLGLTTGSLWWASGLALAFAGAFGNLTDRVVYARGFLNGSVVDFLNYGWSVGNVADIELVLAVVIIVVLLFVGVPLRAKETLEQASATAAGSGVDDR